MRMPWMQMCFKSVVEQRDTRLQKVVRAIDRPAHLLLLRHPMVDDVVHDRFGVRCHATVLSDLFVRLKSNRGACFFLSSGRNGS
jgi:hypothetical protein